MHSRLVADGDLNLGADNFYSVKEVLDALLCKMRARHIPYDVTASNSARWQDVNLEEDPAATPPQTVQDAIDDLLENLHSEDIKYPLPDCSPDTNTLKSYLAADIANIVNEDGKDYARIKDLWDALLCHLDAAKLPIDRDSELCEALKNDAQVKTVQDALNVVCRKESGGCAVTVGHGGNYPSLESAFASEELKKESQISICLLPRTSKGNHVIEKLDVSGKESIAISAHAVKVAVRDELSLEAGDVSLSGIHFSFVDSASSKGRGTGHIMLSSPGDGNVVVKNCHFSRTFYGTATWRPMVSVGKRSNVQWTDNRMQADRQHREILRAVLTDSEETPRASRDAYEGLVRVWNMNPYEDPEKFEVEAAAAAEKISKLSSAERKAWHAKRDVTLIDKLPVAPMRISLPGAVMRNTGPAPATGGTPPTRGTERTPSPPELRDTDTTPERRDTEPTRDTPTRDTSDTRDTGDTRDRGEVISPLPGGGRFEPILRRGRFEPARGIAASAVRRTAMYEVSPKSEVEKFYALLNADRRLEEAEIIDAIRTVSALVTKPDYALTLWSNDVWGWISNNDISGYVALHYGQKDAQPLSWSSTAGDSAKQKLKASWAHNEFGNDLSAKYQLNLHGNHFGAVHSMVNGSVLKVIETILAGGGQPSSTIQSYESVTVTDNTFYEAGSSFVGQFMSLSGNQFLHESEKEAIVAHALGMRATFIGNMSHAMPEGAGYFGHSVEQISKYAIKQPGLNMVQIV